MAGLPEEVDEECGSEESTANAGGRVRAGGLWVADDAGTQIAPRTHPLYKKLSRLNAVVNDMSRGQLKQRLRDLDMEPRLAYVYTCVRLKRLK